MKKILFLGCIVSLFSVASCKKDNVLSPVEEATIKLTESSWNEAVVTVDGIDYSDVYKDFQIKFENNVYTSSGGAPVWATAGTWTFINDEATRIKMDGNREVDISISDDFLEMTFQWD